MKYHKLKMYSAEPKMTVCTFFLYSWAVQCIYDGEILMSEIQLVNCKGLQMLQKYTKLNISSFFKKFCHYLLILIFWRILTQKTPQSAIKIDNMTNNKENI